MNDPPFYLIFKVRIPDVKVDSALILKYLNKMLKREEPSEIDQKVEELISLLKNTLSPENDIFNEPGEDFLFVIDELNNIKTTRDTERKKHYLNRLVKSLTEVKTTSFNDINLNRWKEYSDLKTDSLWVFSKKDRTGSRSGGYWGNFIPQIPNQLIRRYTKKGDWVLDPFSGSGTTLLECHRLCRNSLGLDLSSEAVAETVEKIRTEENTPDIKTEVFNASSLSFDYGKFLDSHGASGFQFIIMHPPYWDIMKFPDDQNDLSSRSKPEDFIKMLGSLTDKVYDYLDPGRYLALVIGDKYNRGEWTPLGFYAMEEIMKRGFSLKSVIVKNFEETRGKMQQKKLWRYRALAGGFYIFKHEYIFLFRKPQLKKPGVDDKS